MARLSQVGRNLLAFVEKIAGQSRRDRVAGESMAVCHTCRLHHTDNETGIIEFLARHHGHSLQIIPLFEVPHAACPERRLAIPQSAQQSIAGYGGNASVKEAFGTATAFTKTNANLATSATAGWDSNSIDNSSNLYLEALVSIYLAAVNTAPANSKAIYLYAFGLIEGTTYTSTGDGVPDGTESTLTYPDITTLPVVAPLLGVVPYPVQNKVLNGGPFSVAACFGGTLPVKWSIGMVNHSGMTLSVTNIYYIEKYLTVA